MNKNSSGSGERKARQGLRYQDRASAKLAYQALSEGTLSFIALADDKAGMFDDFVIGIGGQVVGHQYKSSIKPQPVGVKGLLLGTDQVIADCAASFTMLEAEFPGKYIKVRYVTSHYASSNDKGRFGVDAKDSADFFKEKSLHPEWLLADWQASIWHSVIDDLLLASGLGKSKFELFFSRFEIVFGAAQNIELDSSIDAATGSQIRELALAIGGLVGCDDGKTRWSRQELLDELGWSDNFKQRFEHRFPLGAHVQSNEKTEIKLEDSLALTTTGYLCLLGPPGAGKSTLLERFIRTDPGRIVVRYLAFVPGVGQQQGRGEAENFLTDLNSQLIKSGLSTTRVKDDTLEQRRETFEKLLAKAGERYAEEDRLTIIVVDGLDHVPREERPESSFLRVFPLPHSLPEGVIFILGSQRIDLPDIPREVKDEASLNGRKIDIFPLTESAVGDMVSSVGLAGAVDISSVYSVTRGHPLVTQYLLGKLLKATPDERLELLDGDFEYDGDLEKVYQAAWREAEEADSEVAKVLFTLSFAEGRIEPELLAKCLSSETVNMAYKIAHHLIDHSSYGWQIFHNSFRLFLRQQEISIYGRADPEFSAVAVYRRLAKLAESASMTSTQRWLVFRYLLLAGDRVEAMGLVSRKYFIDQFIDGRSSHELNNDIQDAFVSLTHDDSSNRLFDLMLAKDELWRRDDALSMADKLVAAQIAAAELDSAEAQLNSSHSESDKWLVIQAFLDDGQVDRARAVFDDVDPWEWFDNGNRSESQKLLESWSKYAVVLLKGDQIQRRIKSRNAKTMSGETSQDYEDRLHFALARLTLRNRPHKQVDEVSDYYKIDKAKQAILHLELAKARQMASLSAEALVCICDYETSCDVEKLHGSWHLHAVRLAVASLDLELADRLFQRIEIPSLCKHESQSDAVGNAVRYIVRFSIEAAQLGKPVPEPTQPTELIFRRIQHHAIQLGTMIGNLRTQRYQSYQSVTKLIKASLNLMAGAVQGREDEALLGYRLRFTDEPLFDAIREIVRLVPDATSTFAREFESCLQLRVCSFRESVPILLKFNKIMYDFDGDVALAFSRIEDARNKVGNSRSPQEEADGLSEITIALGNLGFQARAQEVLRQSRVMSLGSNLAAKKDGQYHLWVDLLVAANRNDPTRAAERSFKLLQLISGVTDSDADDQAARISKTVLVEAIACDSAQAWDAFNWARATGIWHWDSLIDAVARGMIRRQPELAIPLAVTWTALCLPYYQEVYNSVTRSGEFLRELVARTPLESLTEVEGIIIAGLERDSKPADRPLLLRTFRDALADRGIISPFVTAAVDRWNAEPEYDEDLNPDYFSLETIEDIDRAVAKERQRRDANTNNHHGDFVNNSLGKRIGRLLANEAWSDVEKFASRNQELLQDWPVRSSVAQVAIAAGQIKYAKKLLIKAKLGDYDGWGGWASRGKIEYHKARHLLGESDAHKFAFEDFIHDISSGRFGSGSALWSVKEIFPLLFSEIDRALLWDQLAEQIEGHRDYKRVEAIPLLSQGINTDIDLLTRLYFDAINFGIFDTREQAENALLELQRNGSYALFCSVCARLIEGDGLQILLGSRLLLQTMHDEHIAAVFREESSWLAAHEDICVAAIGQILGQAWGCDVVIADTELPSTYALDLPPMNQNSTRSLRDSQTLGPVTDDPAAWTEGFETWIDKLASYSDIPSSNIRYRVAQLIDSWGGVVKYGAEASKKHEMNVAPLGLRLPYMRPHVIICFRALHVILGELWRASKLAQINADVLLHQLTGGPVLPRLRVVSTRPVDIIWPLQSENPLRSEATEWVKADDRKRHSPLGCVVGEWARLYIFESGSSFCEEMLVIRGAAVGSSNDLNAAIDSLQKLHWGCGQIMTNPSSECAPMKLRNLHIYQFGNCAEALMFDPVFAQCLGWHQLLNDPYSFYGADDSLMATTRFWRDGWQQEKSYAASFRWAYGQRVELTETGLLEVEDFESLPAPITTMWRTFTPRSGEVSVESYWNSYLCS